MKKLNIKLKKPDFKGLWRHWMTVKKVWRVLTAVCLCLCLAAVCCAAAFKAAGGTLKSQQAALRWAGDSGARYTQVSLFLPDGSGLDKTKIQSFRLKVADSVKDTTPDTVKNLMTDAWSTTGKVSIAGGHGKSDAAVLAVGGNYFYFHPLDLASGSYFSDDDLMKDRVLLDEELAWKLYGGSDLAGLTVLINGTPFVVSGVVKHEDDFADKAAYTDGAALYMSFDAYNKLLAASAAPSASDTTGTDTTGTGTGGQAGTAATGGTAANTTTPTTAAAAAKAGITCYEAVLPNPVSGFASDLVTAELNADKAGAVVENSARYTAGNIWKVLKNYGQRTMHADTVEYPYWENAARLVENRCALFLLLELLFWLFPAVFACVLLVRLYRYLRKKLRDRYLVLKDRYENRTLFHGMKGSDDDGGTDA